MTTNSPTLETARLLLRPPVLDDFDRWAEMFGDKEATRFLGGVQAKPVAWRTFMTLAGAWTMTGVAMFSVIEKESGRWIGRVGPWQPYAWPGTEVGWGLHPDSWGKGYAVEAARATIDYAFATLGWTDVIHCINPGNAASQGVARKLGAVIRGMDKLPVPFEYETVEIWGQTRDEWVRRATQES